MSKALGSLFVTTRLEKGHIGDCSGEKEKKDRASKSSREVVRKDVTASPISPIGHICFSNTHGENIFYLTMETGKLTQVISLTIRL